MPYFIPGQNTAMLHNQSYQLGLIQSSFFHWYNMSSSCKTTLKGAKSVTCATCWKPFTRYGTLGKGFVNSDVCM